MKNLDYDLINECLIARKVDLKEHIELYKRNGELGANSGTYEVYISLMEDKLTKINAELEKVKQIRINLQFKN